MTQTSAQGGPKPTQIRQKIRTSYNWQGEWQIDLTVTKTAGRYAELRTAPKVYEVELEYHSQPKTMAKVPIGVHTVIKRLTKTFFVGMWKEPPLGSLYSRKG